MNIREKFIEIWDNIFDNDEILDLEGEEQFNFIKNILNKNGFKHLGKLKNVEIIKDDIITDPESEDFYSFAEDNINVEKPGGRESRGMTTKNKLPQDFDVWRYNMKNEMFNLVNLKPNTFVNVKGKGKKYIDQVDNNGTNPDNKLQHLAVLIKQGPSDPSDGEWHSFEDLEDSPEETEMDRKEKYNQGKEIDISKNKNNLAKLGTTNKLKEKMKLSKIAEEIKIEIHNKKINEKRYRLQSKK